MFNLLRIDYSPVNCTIFDILHLLSTIKTDFILLYIYVLLLVENQLIFIINSGGKYNTSHL